MDFAGYHPFSLYLDPSFSKNDSVEAAGDDYAIALNLAFNLGTFTENHCLLGDDVAAYVAVNAKRTSKLQRAFQGYTLVDKSGPLFAHAILRGTGPLPCHDYSPSATLLL